jgi:dolichyl-phosphate beta-glucosyltransferase
MSASPYLSVIIPAYNEAQAIASTLGAVRGYLDRRGYRYEVVVAADGTDGTREAAAETTRRDRRFSVIGSAERGGKGKAIRQAVARCSGQIIGFLDADYKTPIEEIEQFLPWFEQGCDLVIGSRTLKEARIDTAQPLYRRLGSRAFNLTLHLILGLWDIADTQCGFKFFRGPVAHDLFRRQRIDGYMFDVEILHLAQRSGYRLKQVGVRWRDDGDSRLRLVSGNWQNLVDILRIRFGRQGSSDGPARPADKGWRAAA